MTSHLLTGVRPYGEDAVDLLVTDGVIAAVGADAADQAPDDVVRHDLAGLVALPGLVDLHTHLREPGGESAETVLSGTRAAASTPVRYTSSPDPSATRPQRGSRAISTIGAKVQSMPSSFSRLTSSSRIVASISTMRGSGSIATPKRACTLAAMRRTRSGAAKSKHWKTALC